VKAFVQHICGTHKMTKTPYFDAYMRGERSREYQYKKNLETLMNWGQYNFFQNIIGTFSEDWGEDD
jgi:hypothetical protein